MTRKSCRLALFVLIPSALVVVDVYKGLKGGCRLIGDGQKIAWVALLTTPMPSCPSLA